MSFIEFKPRFAKALFWTFTLWGVTGCATLLRDKVQSESLINSNSTSERVDSDISTYSNRSVGSNTVISNGTEGRTNTKQRFNSTQEEEGVIAHPSSLQSNGELDERQLYQSKEIDNSGVIFQKFKGKFSWKNFIQRFQDVKPPNEEIIGLYKLAEDIVLSVYPDGKLLVWDVSGTKKPKSFGSLALKVEASAVWNGAEPKLAIVNQDRIEILSLTDLSIEYTLPTLKTKMLEIDFAPDGESLLMGAADSKVYRWKFVAEAKADRTLEKRKSLERYIGHSAVVSSIAFHPSGRAFFSGDWDGVLSAWKNFDADQQGGKYDKDIFADRFFTEEQVRVNAPRANKDRIDILKVSQDGKYLLVATSPGNIELWKIRGLIKVAEVNAHSGRIFNLSFLPDNMSFITSGRDGTVKKWNIASREDQITIVKNSELDLPLVKKVIMLDSDRAVGCDNAGNVFLIVFNTGAQ